MIALDGDSVYYCIMQKSIAVFPEKYDKGADNMKKRILSLLLCFSMLLSLMPMGVFAFGGSDNNNNTDAVVEPWVYVPESDGYSAFASADEEANTLTITVKATKDGWFGTSSDETISGATVTMVNGSKTLWSGKTGSDGTVKIPLKDISEADLRCATVSAYKTMATGKGISGSGRDKLFNYFPKDSKGNYIRYEYELHSETIDTNGNWIGKKIPKLSSSQAVDVAFAIDATGSMSDEINNVKTNVANFADSLIKRGLNVRFSIIEYRDITCDEATVWHSYNGSHWYNTAAAVQDVLGGIRATGGGDTPETVIDALGIVASNSMYWRSDAYKFAFVLTDADYKVDNNYGYSSMAELVKVLKAKNIMTSVITASSYQSTYSSLINGTGGIYANINSSDFKAEMMNLADSIVGKTNAKMELKLKEPRMLYNMSVAYLANDKTSKSASYRESMKNMLNEYAKVIADSTDGHVLINKVILFGTSALQNFYNTKDLAAMADIHIQTTENERGLHGGLVQIHSNAYVHGFYTDSKVSSNTDVKEDRFVNLPNPEAYQSKKTFQRIQMSAVEGANWDNSFIDEAFDYATTVGHESGHYIFGFYDEYMRWDEETWYDLGYYPNRNYGLMDGAHYHQELSKTGIDYGYFGSSAPKAGTKGEQVTKHWYEYGGSTEDTMADMLETGELANGWFGYDLDLGDYIGKYSKARGTEDRYTSYAFSELSDSSFIGIPISGTVTASVKGIGKTASGIDFEKYTEASSNIADIRISRSGDKLNVEMEAADAKNVKVYGSTDGINFSELSFAAASSASGLSLDGAQQPEEMEIPEETIPEETEAPAEEPAEEEDVLTEAEDVIKEDSEETEASAAEGAEEITEEATDPTEETAEVIEEAAEETKPSEETEETAPAETESAEEEAEEAPAEEAEPVEEPEEEDSEEAKEASSTVRAVISDVSDKVIELRVLSSASGSYNIYYADCTETTSVGAIYTALDYTVTAYVNSNGSQSFLFLADSREYANGSYVSVNQATQISAADGKSFNGGEIYSVAHRRADINFSTLSWFVKRADGSWEKLATDISEEENMNPGARANISGAGTYVLMAQKAAGTAKAVTNLKYTNSTTVDGVVTLTFSNPNSNTKFINVYISSSPFSTADAAGTVRTFHAGESIIVDLLERERTAYIGVEAVLENGNRSPLTMITVDTGSVDRDHDGIPDWYCDENLLWGDVEEDKDIAKADDDGDGLTNLEEFKGGSDPKNPNDPVKTTNVPVTGLTLSTKKMVLTVGTEQKVSAKITPSDATNKSIYWMVEDTAVASVSGAGRECTVTGLSSGTTTLYAITHDGGYAEACTVTVIDGLNDIHLSQEYLAMDLYNAPVQLKILPTPSEAVTGITWTAVGPDGKPFAKGAEVVTVDKDGTVKPVRQGTAYVLATVSVGELSASARCRVDVVEGTGSHPIAADVKVNGVTLVTAKATSNLYSTEYTMVDVLLNLEQNMSIYSDATSLGNLGAAIERASFVDTTAAKYFTLRVADDRTLEIIPTDQARRDAKNVKSSYKSAIRVTVDGSSFTTDPLTLTVKKTLPTIKAAAVKINSFAPVSAAIKFTGGTVTGVRANGSLPNGFRLDGMNVAYTGSAAKASAKLNLLAAVDGCTEERPVTVSVSVARTEPTVSLSITDAPEKEAESESRSVKAAGTLSSVGNLGYTTMGDNFIIIPPANPGTPGNPAPSIPTQKKVTSVTLLPNSRDTVYLKVDVSPAQFAGSDIQMTLTDSKGGNISNALVSKSYDNGIITLSSTSLTPYGGTYKLSVNVVGSTKKATVTVKTLAEKAKPTLSLKATGSIDAAIANSPITLKANVSNYHMGNDENYMLSVTRSAKGAITEDVSALFAVKRIDNTLILTADAPLEKGYTYTATVAADLNGDGRAECEKSVKLNVKWSDPSKVKPVVTLKVSGSIDVVRPGSYVKVTPDVKNSYNYDLKPEDLQFYEGSAMVSGTDLFDVTVENGSYIIMNKGASSASKYSVAYTGMVDGVRMSTKPVSISVKMGTAKMTQSTKEVTLLKKDRFDSAIVHLAPADGALSRIARVEQDSTSAALYTVVDLGNGNFAITFKDFRPASKAATVKLNVYLVGNQTSKPNASVSVKVTLK